jgi:hypothetical protein
MTPEALKLFEAVKKRVTEEVESIDRDESEAYVQPLQFALDILALAGRTNETDVWRVIDTLILTDFGEDDD